MKRIMFLLLLLIFLSASAYAQNQLEAEFENPPVTARPKALWPWLNGNVNLAQLTYELEEAKRKGMGGFDIWDIGSQIDPDSVIPIGPEFLGDESVQAIAHAIREADRLGLELGLTFSSSWNAGGSWVKPEHGAMGLFRSDTIVTGPRKFSARITFPEIPEKYGDKNTLQQRNPKTGLPTFYKEVALIAHKIEKDSTVSLTNVVSISSEPSGKIIWNVPSGTWRIVRYVCAPTGQPLAIPSANSQGLMLDHFSAEAQRSNMSYIFSRLLPATGPLKGRSLKYLYADSYEVNSAVWTPLLNEEFKKRNTYSLEKYLPALDGFKVESHAITERFLFDFRKTLSDLIIDNHYKLGRELCEKEGLGFVAEAGGPGKPIHNVPFEDLKALGALTVPRGEFWNKHPLIELLQIIKGISSASHIYNQKYVEAESFTSVWLWQEGPDELKPLADRAMCEGLNRFVYHTFPHTPPESGDPGWVYNFGTLINTTNGWWPKSKGFHDYLARCSHLLQQGNFVGDVAFYYGDDAPNFVPPKRTSPSLGFGYDYDVVNSDVILNRMTVKDGRILLPHGQSYEVLVLPHKSAMNTRVLKKLEQLVRDGATIIGPKPGMSLGLNGFTENDKTIQTVSSELWGKADSIHVTENRFGKGNVVWGKTIRDVLNAKGIGPDLQVSDNAAGKIDFIHRRTNSDEIYFVRNTTKESMTTLLTLRVPNGKPEFWNPETGEIFPIPFSESTGGGIRFPLTLRGNGSCFIVLRKDGSTTSGKTVVEKTSEIFYTKEGAVTPAAGEIKLEGPWELSFEQSRGGIASATWAKLIPLNQSTDDRIRYYSGNTTYRHTFKVRKEDIKPDQRMWLDLGVVAEIADVFVNGKDLGSSWHAPFIVDITDALQAGDNYLIVEVVNTPHNRLVGDAKLPAQYQRTRSNIKKLPNAWMKPFAEAPLRNAGLLGPVQIRFVKILR